MTKLMAFLKGVTAAFVLFPDPTRFEHIDVEWNDARAQKKDWVAVGQDIRSSMKETAIGQTISGEVGTSVSRNG